MRNKRSSCLCNLIPSSAAIDNVEGFIELCLPTTFSFTLLQLKDVPNEGDCWSCPRIAAVRSVTQAYLICGDPRSDLSDAQELPLGILPLFAQCTRLCSCKQSWTSEAQYSRPFNRPIWKFRERLDAKLPRTEARDKHGDWCMTFFHPTMSAVAHVNLLDIRSIPLTSLLSPFFAMIRSPLSTGPITSTALSSLHTVFLSGLITLDSPSVENALAELSATISHCKFEPSDSSGDEVVLFKILAIIRDCICSPIGKVLGDMEVCEMLETVLTTCCQMRLSGKHITSKRSGQV